MSDPISDLLTRLRNASSARKEECIVPHSHFKEDLLGVLLRTGYITGFATRGTLIREILVQLKYVNGVSAITGIRRESTPGRRIYKGYGDIPRVLNGLGVSILSTSRGVLDDRSCRREKLGGELVCSVW